jgi:hypothetical protein
VSDFDPDTVKRRGREKLARFIATSKRPRLNKFWRRSLYIPGLRSAFTPSVKTTSSVAVRALQHRR